MTQLDIFAVQARRERENPECPSCGCRGGHEPLCPASADLEPVNTRETSRAAYASVADALPHLEGVVLDFVRKQGPATCDAVEAGTGLTHQCCSARVNKLVERGLLIPLRDEAGEPVKRPTRQGRKAFVWRAA